MWSFDLYREYHLSLGFLRFECFGIEIGGSCYVCQAKSELKRSAVADNLSGKSTVSNVRTSSGTFISKGKVWVLMLCSFWFFVKKLQDLNQGFKSRGTGLSQIFRGTGCIGIRSRPSTWNRNVPRYLDWDARILVGYAVPIYCYDVCMFFLCVQLIYGSLSSYYNGFDKHDLTMYNTYNNKLNPQICCSFNLKTIIFFKIKPTVFPKY